jgi:hypothetical protein
LIWAVEVMMYLDAARLVPVKVRNRAILQLPEASGAPISACPIARTEVPVRAGAARGSRSDG